MIRIPSVDGEGLDVLGLGRGGVGLGGVGLRQEKTRRCGGRNGGRRGIRGEQAARSGGASAEKNPHGGHDTDASMVAKQQVGNKQGKRTNKTQMRLVWPPSGPFIGRGTLEITSLPCHELFCLLPFFIWIQTFL